MHKQGGLIIHFASYCCALTSSGVGVFFLRQDDHPGVSKGQMAAAAWKGK
jgi:hypothetical protein